MKKIVLIGGGGHAKVLIDLIKSLKAYKVMGLLDPALKIGELIAEITVLGNDKLLSELYKKGVRDACIAIGSIKDNSKRKDLYFRVKKEGFSVPSLIHPKATVSGSSRISDSVQIMAGAVIQTDCSIGENTIINTGAIVDHDCYIGSCVHICPGAVISGGCNISEGAFIGAGTTIIHGITIGKNAIVAAGAVVINDVPDNSMVKGIPAI